MAAVKSREGLIIMSPGDTYAPETSEEIHTIIVDNTSGSGNGILRKFAAGTGPIAFTYSNGAGSALTSWWDLKGCVTTNGGLFASGTDVVFYIYVK